MPVHRMVGDGKKTACGLKVAEVQAVRFVSYVRAFCKRNPEHRPCKKCWEEDVMEDEKDVNAIPD